MATHQREDGKTMPDRNSPTRPVQTEEGTLSVRHLPGLATERARRALAARDVSAVYRLLTESGISQRQIAHMTGQSQSEVSEIVKGRRVMAYDVLVRIAEGLGVQRGSMGLAYDEAVE